MARPILHITDLHITGAGDENENKPIREMFDAILNASWKQKPFVIITGDISNGTGNRQSIKGDYEFADRLIKEIRRDGFQTLVLPGNHDYSYYGTIGVQLHNDIFESYFGKPDYPVLVQDGDWKVFGVNSMSFKHPQFPLEFAKGKVGKRQRKKLESALDNLKREPDDRVLVCLHHHPFILPDTLLAGVIKNKIRDLPLAEAIIEILKSNTGVQQWEKLRDLKLTKLDLAFLGILREWLTHCLVDGEDFCKVMKDKVDLLLFGHDHIAWDFSNVVSGANLPQQYGIRKILSGGTARDGVGWLVEHNTLNATPFIWP